MSLTFPVLFALSCAVSETPAVESEARAPLAEVAFVGASVTAGYGSELAFDGERGKSSTSFDLAAVLEAGTVADTFRYRSYGNLLFFGEPEVLGPKVLKTVLAEEPTMIVALDFLFWFAYGAADHEGQPIVSREQRFMKLEYGLALLEPIECTLAIGDLADMSSAVGTMLMPSFVPDAETLAILNGRIHEWADERENTLVIPLAATVARIQADEGVVLGEYAWPAGCRAKLIHEDKLHSTIEGTIALCQLIATRLAEEGVVEASAFDLAPAKVLARLKERAVETDRKLRAVEASSTTGG